MGLRAKGFALRAAPAKIEDDVVCVRGLVVESNSDPANLKLPSGECRKLQGGIIREVEAVLKTLDDFFPFSLADQRIRTLARIEVETAPCVLVGA